MTEVVAVTPALPELRDEKRDIVLWRVDQFQRLGYREDQAWRLALSQVDLGEARRLGRSGCPVEVALRILL